MIKITTFFFLLLFFINNIFIQAQTVISDKKTENKTKNTEVNFLFNYYTQDGDHSPVTGGTGTEELKNYASAIIIHLLPDSLTNINLEIGVDAYTSASTNNIDYFRTHKSSASGKDGRGHINIDYTKALKQSNNEYRLMLGFSIESDINSTSVGGKYIINSANQLKSFSIGASYFRDNWKLIYPYELRKKDKKLKEDIRKTFSLQFSYSQVINKKSQASISSELVFQSGLLSTPFHRVFFSDALGKPFDELKDLSHLELLRDKRFKLPVSIRYHHYINDFIRLRTYYRFYTDSWGLQAHTISLETPFVASQSLILAPFIRYHTQSNAKDFVPFGGVDVLSTPSYYTSDYDLSKLHSYKYGLGISYSPYSDIANFKSPFRKAKIAQLKSINVRTAYYKRSDGLKAYLTSLDLEFTF